jgi:hypothetical protein
MSKAEDFLVEKQVSNTTKEAVSDTFPKLPEEDRAILMRLVSQKFSEPVAAKEAAAVVSKNKKAWRPILGEDLFDELLEELKEIASDLKWSKSKRGQMIIYANAYAERVYQTLRQDKRFEDVYIGSHPEKLQLMMVGKVTKDSDLQDLQKLIATHPSTYPLEIKVNVT